MKIPTRFHETKIITSKCKLKKKKNSVISIQTIQPGKVLNILKWNSIHMKANYRLNTLKLKL